MEKLVLENLSGHVARTFAWKTASGESAGPDSDDAVLVQRLDTRRLELCRSLQSLEANKVSFIELARINRRQLATAPVLIEGLGRLRLATIGGETTMDPKPRHEGNQLWYASLLTMAALMVAFVSFLFTRPHVTPKMEAELKQEVVQIVKHLPPKPPARVMPTVQDEARPVEAPVTKITVKTASIKRLGALAVLGSLSKSKQHGGVDLGAVNTTAGPGLGGNAGSGGVQTSLYGKGLVAAPLGVGGNMQGGGGYGTKGKGGGKAGYGKLSLVGSSGMDPIPLGREAIIEGGLDRELIADVIAKNIGQVLLRARTARDPWPGGACGGEFHNQR
jgi:hypothetical protein